MENTNNKILLVEDDRNFGDVLRSYLEMYDYEVILASDGIEGWDKYKRETFDLCILDVMMPRKDGFSLAKDIRENDTEIPIIFLTAKALKQDVLQGLKIGADDYITKPFNSEELLLRIQAVLKRSSKKPDPRDDIREFTFGKFHFDFQLRILTFDKGGDAEDKQKLSPKEAQLLRLFALYVNEVLPRSEALTKIWGQDDYFTARSMDVFVTKLRKYLKKDPNTEIINIHGNGFQLFVKEEE